MIEEEILGNYDDPDEEAIKKIYASRIKRKHMYSNSFINIHENPNLNFYLYRRTMRKIKRRVKTDVIP